MYKGNKNQFPIEKSKLTEHKEVRNGFQIKPPRSSKIIKNILNVAIKKMKNS